MGVASRLKNMRFTCSTRVFVLLINCAELKEGPGGCAQLHMMATGNGDSAAAGDPKSQEGLTVSTDEIKIVPYSSELQMPAIMRLIKEDLSEPYSIYTYRYFIYNWPFLCWMVGSKSKLCHFNFFFLFQSINQAFEEEECIGVIVSKIEIRHGSVKRGYIAMLAVDKSHRRKGIGTFPL